MNFISYAQNFEDLMLWRALKHIQGGCYVDIGAQHPIVDSVSKAFYEHGWKGVHIEPVPEYAGLLRQDRPDETVLQVAIGEENGTLELNIIPGTGLSTGIRSYAERHQQQYGFAHQRLLVPLLTLTSALDFLRGQEVHWLKIDVEGLEAAVLKGWDYSCLRPWIIVIEATIPTTSSMPTETPSWMPILERAEYISVYFDGLNRFYVAKEHAELQDAFRVPPNVFDSVQLSGLASSELCRKLISEHKSKEKLLNETIISLNSEHKSKEKLLNETISSLEKRLDAAAKNLTEATDQHLRQILFFEKKFSEERRETADLISQKRELEYELLAAKNIDTLHINKIEELSQSLLHWQNSADQLKNELNTFYASKSWRVTKPLRQILKFTKSSIFSGTSEPTKRHARPWTSWAMRYVLSNAQLQKHALNVLAQHPALKQRLRQFALRAGVIGAAPVSNDIAQALPVAMNDGELNLSPRAAHIYADLNKILNTRNS